jgi:hypothetical protein
MDVRIIHVNFVVIAITFSEKNWRHYFRTAPPYLQTKITTIHTWIVTGCTITVRFQAGIKQLFAATSTSAPRPTQLPTQCLPGTLPLEVKKPKHKGNQSPPNTDKVNNVWIYTFIPPFVYMAWFSHKKISKMGLSIFNSVSSRSGLTGDSLV